MLGFVLLVGGLVSSITLAVVEFIAGHAFRERKDNLTMDNGQKKETSDYPKIKI
jgi:hypothetical protein